MVELQQSINDKDTVRACLLVARHFSKDLCINQFYHQLHVLARSIQQDIVQVCDPEQRLHALIRCFYRNLAFTGNEQDFFCSKYSLIDQVLAYRAGIPVSLAIVFSQLAGYFGLAVRGVNFPGHFLMRFQASADKAIFIDPLDGKILDWCAMEKRYFHILDELENETMPPEALQSASTEEIVVRLLHNLKAAFINENKLQNALSASEMLVNLCPNDPYERRDRGFLLHQLECPQVAFADYQYFVRQCPDDPSAQLLRQQLNHWQAEIQQTLH